MGCRLKSWLCVTVFFLVSGGRMAAGAPVVINELLASNSANAQDAQGEYADWVELYNAGESTADLSGMYLTDNLQESDDVADPVRDDDPIPGLSRDLARTGMLTMRGSTPVSNSVLVVRSWYSLPLTEPRLSIMLSLASKGTVCLVRSIS